jgi:hypothetical protein
MSRRARLTFLGWTIPKREGYVNRQIGESDLFGHGEPVRDAMQHEGNKLKAYLKVKKLIPRYNRTG